MKISSIIKKVMMALSGLALVGFLVTHLAGNLLIYKLDPKTNTGDDFNKYGEYLEHNPLLPLAEIALLALFIMHVSTALRLTLENRAARPIAYAERKTAGESTFSSRTMWYTGMIIFGFIALHIWQFKFGNKEGVGKLWGLVVSEFQKPVILAVYVAAMLALGLHIAHGISSAFQSLGLFSLKRSKLKLAGQLIGWAIALGFAAIPVWSFTQHPGTLKPGKSEVAGQIVHEHIAESK